MHLWANGYWPWPVLSLFYTTRDFGRSVDKGQEFHNFTRFKEWKFWSVRNLDPKSRVVNTRLNISDWILPATRRLGGVSITSLRLFFLGLNFITMQAYGDEPLEGLTFIIGSENQHADVTLKCRYRHSVWCTGGSLTLAYNCFLEMIMKVFLNIRGVTLLYTARWPSIRKVPRSIAIGPGVGSWFFSSTIVTL